MIVMVHATYPPTVVSKLIQVYTSAELPKRPDAVKELASIVFGDRGGYHAVEMLEVPESELGRYMTSQTERSVFLETRVEGLHVEYHYGYSIMESVGLAGKVAAK